MSDEMIVIQSKIMPICEISHEPSCSKPMTNVGMDISAPIPKTNREISLNLFDGAMSSLTIWFETESNCDIYPPIIIQSLDKITQIPQALMSDAIGF